MAAPVMTFNTAGNALASQSIAAAGTQTFNLDLSAKFEGQLIVTATFGTIAATAGLKVECFEGYGSGPTYPTTNPNFSYTLAAVAGNQQTPKIALPTGKWQVKLTNLDATNGLTLVIGTVDTVDSVV